MRTFAALRFPRLRSMIGIPESHTVAGLDAMLRAPVQLGDLPRRADGKVIKPDDLPLVAWIASRNASAKSSECSAVSVLVLDVDHGEIPLDRTVRALSSELGGALVLGHTTTSHRPHEGVHALRVLVPLSRDLSVVEHRDAHAALSVIAARVPIERDPNAKDATRKSYVPAEVRGIPYEHARAGAALVDPGPWIRDAERIRHREDVERRARATRMPAPREPSRADSRAVQLALRARAAIAASPTGGIDETLRRYAIALGGQVAAGTLARDYVVELLRSAMRDRLGRRYGERDDAKVPRLVAFGEGVGPGSVE